MKGSRTRTMVALMAGALMLGGCVDAAGPRPSQGEIDRVVGERALRGDLSSDPSALRAFLSDSTVVAHDASFGTQIEYHAPDGTSWLLFPGNRAVLRGQWEVRPRLIHGRNAVCYRYARDTFNPVTRKTGGGWECGSWYRYANAQQVVDGDVLGLRGRGAVPAPMPPRPAYADIQDIRKLWTGRRGPAPANKSLLATRRGAEAYPVCGEGSVGPSGEWNAAC